jgi:hypothetical protein
VGDLPDHRGHHIGVGIVLTHSPEHEMKLLATPNNLKWNEHETEIENRSHCCSRTTSHRMRMDRVRVGGNQQER